MVDVLSLHLKVLNVGPRKRAMRGPRAAPPAGFPAGRVVGLDSDPAHAQMSPGFVSERRPDRVEVVATDARSTGLPAGAFDLVHARTLLINVPAPGQVVAEMVRLAKPGAWVAGLEAEPELSVCYPPHPAFDRIYELFIAAFARTGADPQVGRKMAGL